MRSSVEVCDMVSTSAQERVLEGSFFSDCVLLRSPTAEDVLGDLGVRQAMKKIPANVRL